VCELRNYIIKRLLLFIPTIIGVSIGIFFIMRVVPGDVAATVLRAGDREQGFTQEEKQDVIDLLGLDRPLYMQYAEWMWGVIRFDLGDSWIRRTPIINEMKNQFPVTLQLASLSAVIVALFSIPIGILAAVYQDKWPDYILRGIAVVALAMPTFFIGLLTLLVLSMYFRWLPPAGFVHLWDQPWDSIRQLIFPAMALGFHSAGYVLRMVRAQMLEVMREDYIRTARAKGLVEYVVIMRHALRNALLPVVTLFGFQVIFLLAGTVAIEQIFSLSGMGQALLTSVFLRDLPIVQSYVLYIALVAMTLNLLVDLTYGWLDPRIQYS